MEHIDIAPELADIAAWFNTEPLFLESLRGRPVLLNFWTYASLYSTRTLPAVQRLWETYRDAGFVVIGVHTPQFYFEKDPDHVLAAVKEHGITYPVALDADRETWHRYGNMTRQRRTLIDPTGTVRYEDVGFGGFTDLEQVLRNTLNRNGADLPERCFDSEPHAVDAPVALELASPRILLGEDGPPLGNATTQVCTPHVCLAYDDRYPAEHRMNRVYLQGKWVQREEFVEYRGEAQRDYAAMRFTGTDAHLVVEAFRPRTRIGVLLDHEPVPPEHRGADIVAEGNRTYLEVDRPRRYHVADLEEPSVAELTLLPANDARLYAFEFA